MKGIDLNSKKSSRISIFGEISEVNRACRKTCLRSGHGTHTHENFPPLRTNIQRKPQDQIFQLPGSIPVHGICSVDLSGESQRDRDLPSSAKQEALSHGYTWRHCSQYIVQRQQGARLENLRRLCPSIDKDRQTLIRRRRSGARTRQYNLRTRFFHHRSVSLGISMGPVSVHQVSRQTSHSARSTRQHSNVHSYLGWKDARCEDSRHPDARGWSILHHGSGLPGFFETIQHQSSGRVFRHPDKKQYSIPAPIFSHCHSRGEIIRNPLRSDHHAHRRLLKERLPSAVATNQILRHQKQQDFQFIDQQLHCSSPDNSRSLSLPIAGRTVLQMD